MTPRPIAGSIVGAAYTRLLPGDQATSPIQTISVCAKCKQAICPCPDHDWSGTPKS